MNAEFWLGKRVFLTGHTGFKGGWLSLWLQALGVELTGYALKPPTDPSLFQVAEVGGGMRSIIADVRELDRLKTEIAAAKPDIVIHMAAQPLVRASYLDPVGTYSVNVMGTVNVLEAVRNSPNTRVVLNITTDKCYENREWLWSYREIEPIGGHDPYSNSKACSELITTAYRSSFFPPERYSEHGVAIASARAGNVIGGGDWADDRLIPDLVRACNSKKNLVIRDPSAVRPWQHVLDPLRGYLMLAEKLYQEGPRWGEPWNFGPGENDNVTVDNVIHYFYEKWKGCSEYSKSDKPQPYEAHFLRLDSTKSRSKLGWIPRWHIERAVSAVVEWHRAHAQGENMKSVTENQITSYLL